MNFQEHIDIYCERTDASFWSEPVNAITNFAFIIGALFLIRLYRATARNDWQAACLIVIVCTVGIGSFLFHTVATRWALLADVIPITIFIFFYLWVALRRLVGLKKWQTAFCLAGFFAVAQLAESVPREFSFNGSITYFPSLAAIIIIGSLLKYKSHPLAAQFFLAFGIFAVSLTFRSIDMMLCPILWVGTHFLWHCLNGLLLYVLTRVIIHTPPKQVI